MEASRSAASGRGSSRVSASFQVPPEMVRNLSRARAEGAVVRFGVRLGSYHLLIAAQTFSEVVARAACYPIPHTPPWFLGLLNQRGNLLPVFDVHQLLHTGEAEHDRHTVLVLDQGSEAVGLCIDGMPESVVLEQRLRQVPSLPTPLAAHVVAAYRCDQTTWLDFEHQGFFTTIGQQMAQEPGADGTI